MAPFEGAHGGHHHDQHRPLSRQALDANGVPIWHTDRFENVFRSPYSSSSSPTTRPSTHEEFNDGSEQSDYEPNVLMPLEYVEPDDEMIASVDEKKEILVAMDSGCVAHTVHPRHVPSTVAIDSSGDVRDFTDAGGGSIANHGKIAITLEQEELADVDSSASVADVCRPLHSVSTTCDTGKEVLFTRGMCTVVPEGALSRFLGQVKQHARYPRKGGLYVARMRVKARGVRDPKPKPKAGFGRQGRRT